MAGECQRLESERCRQLIDKLREFGLDKHIELPQVAIMGDTSSGKSSVLSALSGITFPSSDQLTTRCPTQLVLTHAETFSGNVTLKRYEPRPAEKIVPTQISSLEEITSQIERLTKQLVDEGQSISDDSIVIKVAGPEFPNLTLIDLPGIVRTVESGEDKSIIPRIQALVKRYLEQSRTMILAVVPANVDIHNTGILQAAEEVDPEGIRTQGIITKLDLIDEGAERSVLDILLNRKKHLKLGYHAVKCRGQKELNEKVSIQEGNNKEKIFFETSKFWSRTQVPENLVGIGNLRSKLVTLLEEIIIRELPNVISDIDDKMAESQEKLTRLGEPMDSVGLKRSHYSKCTDAYLYLMKSTIEGNYSVSDFFQTSPENQQQDNRFRAIVRKKDELFQTEITTRTHKFDYMETKGTNLSVGDSVRVVPHVVAGKEPEAIYGTIQSKGADSGSDADSDSGSYADFCEILTEDGAVKKCYNRSNDFSVRSLEKIKVMIAANRGNELSIFPSNNIFCSIVQTYVGQWKDPTMKLFEDYMSDLSKVSTAAIEYLKVKPTVRNHFESRISSILKTLRESVVRELQGKLLSERRPSTLNHYLWDNLTKLRNKPLLDAITALDNPKGARVLVSAVLAIVKNYGVGQTSNEENVAMETEYAVIAYLKVASKRFIDEVPMLLNDHLLCQFLEIVKEKLNVTDKVLSPLLAESPRIIQLRKELRNELEALLASKEEVSQMQF